MYDITIVGGGPAGATLARLIGKRFKVLLLDKRQLVNPMEENASHKCCGGLLAPDAQHMLAKLGLGVPRDVLVGPQLFTVRTIDMDNRIERYYQRHYINVDREKFDRFLISLVPSSVEIRCGVLFQSFKRADDGIEVTFSRGNKKYTEHTQILVAADGAFSTVRRLAFPQEDPSKLYISIQEWFKVSNALPYFSSIFDTEITDFYSWTIPKEDALIIGAAIPYRDGTANVKFEKLKEKLRNYGFEFQHPVRRNGAFIVRPRKLGQTCVGQEGIAFIGEAGGFISPSSAEGMSYAFRSALAFAQSLEQGETDVIKAYSKNIKSLKRNILMKNIKCPGMYHPLLRKWVMNTGVMSMKIQQE